LVCRGSSQIEYGADNYQIGLGKDSGCTAFVRLTGQPPWRSAIGVSHLCDVGSWRLAHNRGNTTYWSADKSGHWPAADRIGKSPIAVPISLS